MCCIMKVPKQTFATFTKEGVSRNGRKPVKKISASATVLLTLKVEVQSPYNRINGIHHLLFPPNTV